MIHRARANYFLAKQSDLILVKTILVSMTLRKLRFGINGFGKKNIVWPKWPR